MAKQVFYGRGRVVDARLMGQNRPYVGLEVAESQRARPRRDDWVPNNPIVPDKIETWWHGITTKPTAPAGEKKRKTLLDALNLVNAFRRGFQNSQDK
jgi:hypothetical protein